MSIIEFNKEENSYIKLRKINTIKTNEVDPILELYRGKLFTNLIKYFINDCLLIFGSEIFSKKKSFTRTITNILSCWMFNLY